MSNILIAIKNLVQNPIVRVTDRESGRNRINAVGASLELYIKDLLANCNTQYTEAQKLEKYAQIFSYLGNQNNPPDLMLKNGDAVEIKKIQSAGSAIALNSSYPKSKLSANSSMITASCKTCELWSVKDLIYVIGQTSDDTIKNLWFVYGDIYCASPEIYERITTTISNGINSIPHVEFSKTNELGKVKKVDPLGITNLRIRGMWHIEHPRKAFSYLDLSTSHQSFQFFCLMRKEKFESFDQADRSALNNLNTSLSIDTVKIKNPDNPAQLIDAILIKFSI